jgi:hypothetical protein
MASIHDNEARADAIFAAIFDCLVAKEGPTYGNVAKRLPSDQGPFDLLDEELTEAIAELKSKGGGELPEVVSPEAQEKIEALRANATEPPHNDVADSTLRPEISQAESLDRMQAAHNALGAARVAVKIGQQKVADTKAALASAVVAWQTASDPLTPDQRREREVRNHLAAMQAERASRRNATAITARQFVQKTMKNGPQRGAFSMQQAARVGFRMPGTGGK